MRLLRRRKFCYCCRVDVFEPLAFLAAVFAIVAAQSWWAVAKVADQHASDASRVNRKLYMAASMTALVLVLGAASLIVLPIAALLV